MVTTGPPGLPWDLIVIAALLLALGVWRVFPRWARVGFACIALGNLLQVASVVWPQQGGSWPAAGRLGYTGVALIGIGASLVITQIHAVAESLQAWVQQRRRARERV